jgi:mono/diheme cytochrome c family protein
VEIALVVAVFAAASVLTQTSTAKGELAQEAAEKNSAQKFEQTTTAAGGIELDVSVTPNRVGLNDYSVLITDAQGNPVETITQTRLRFTFEDIPGAIAPSELLLNEFSPGNFQGSGAYFTQPGNWRISLNVRRSDGDDVAQDYVVPVLRPEVSPNEVSGGRFDLPFKSFTWNEVAGMALILGGALVFLYRRQLQGLRRTAYRGALTGGAVLMVAGGVLAFGVDQHTNAQDPRQGNPVAPTEDSVARGKELFQQNCVACHGVDGRGDGPDAAELNPKPTDFRLHMPLHTDPQFYAFIHDGYAGSAMPKFGSAFSEDDIWNLVNFLRAEFGGGGATQ